MNQNSTNTTKHRSLAGIAVVLIAAVLASVPAPSIWAQQDDYNWIAHRLELLLGAIGSPVFSTRELATKELLEHSIEVAGVLNANPVVQTFTPEQQTRVLRVLEDAFRKTPRAGLGVSFARQNLAQGAMLASVLPAFPASKTLQPEDVVIEVDGERLAAIGNGLSTQYLRRAIISRDPGDYLPMRILRGGEEFQVQVELGRYKDLGDAQPLQQIELGAAWEYRLQLLQLQPAHNQSKIDVIAMGTHWTPDRLRMLRRPDAAKLYAGGRSAVSNIRLLSQAVVNAAPQTLQQQAQLRQIPLQRNREKPSPDRDRDRLVQQVVVLQQELVDLQVHLNDDSLTEVERQLTSRLIIQLQSKQRDLRQALIEIPR